jgi:hypothetical protein
MSARVTEGCTEDPEPNRNSSKVRVDQQVSGTTVRPREGWRDGRRRRLQLQGPSVADRKALSDMCRMLELIDHGQRGHLRRGDQGTRADISTRGA